MTLTEYDEAKVLQQLKEEYLEEGIELGIEQGKDAERRVLIKQMCKCSDIQTVSNMTGISVDEIERLIK